MAFGTKNKGQAQENEYKTLANTSRTAADTATATAAQPDPLEARQRNYALALDKWRMGESGPIDVRNMPGGDVNMSLYQDAMKVHDAGRVGGGAGTMSGTANPNFVAALQQENEMNRHRMASGALEQNVEGQLSANDARMTGLADRGNARNLAVAGMREGRYESDADRQQRYLLRPRQPNFFRQLAMQFAGGAGAAAAA